MPYHCGIQTMHNNGLSELWVNSMAGGRRAVKGVLRGI
jgi:hypothetical protein